MFRNIRKTKSCSTDQHISLWASKMNLDSCDSKIADGSSWDLKKADDYSCDSKKADGFSCASKKADDSSWASKIAASKRADGSSWASKIAASKMADNSSWASKIAEESSWASKITDDSKKHPKSRQSKTVAQAQGLFSSYDVQGCNNWASKLADDVKKLADSQARLEARTGCVRGAKDDLMGGTGRAGCYGAVRGVHRTSKFKSPYAGRAASRFERRDDPFCTPDRWQTPGRWHSLGSLRVEAEPDRFAEAYKYQAMQTPLERSFRSRLTLNPPETPETGYPDAAFHAKRPVMSETSDNVENLQLIPDFLSTSTKLSIPDADKIRKALTGRLTAHQKMGKKIQRLTAALNAAGLDVSAPRS